MFTLESIKISLYFLVISSFIYILVDNNKFWIFLFSHKIRGFYNLDEENFNLKIIDKDLALKTMGVNEDFVNYVFGRNNIKEAFILYFICRDYLVFIDNKLVVKLKEGKKINKYESLNSPILTVSETSMTSYFLYSLVAMIIFFLSHKYFKGDLDALILSSYFSIILLYLGVAKLIERKLYELAKKFTELD
ncbi:hypothetical protein [Acinetobacter radioresistens]|uniref:hypothetical protein n=1 Tax=Acinetobacter radioresistens TaxID=40216 RepID=UPI00224612E0|nr:hypothetical protein [Acinetobacter radioresistens]MCX0333706.1 hypothetical protein [Acinetobacter radioresistens]